MSSKSQALRQARLMSFLDFFFLIPVKTQHGSGVNSMCAIPSGSNKGPEIALVRPKAVEKYDKVIVACRKMTEAAKKAVTEALQLAEENKHDDKLQTAYEVNCVTRLYMLEVCEASSIA